MDQTLDITWTFANALFDYWSDYPPTHELVAAYLGIEQKKKSNWEGHSMFISPGAESFAPLVAANDMTGSTIDTLVAMFPNGVIKI